MLKAAVIGLGFGDEGKGTTTEYLCSQFSNPLVIRFSGGHQAGHTVVHDDVSHIFSNFGSGTLSGYPTYWSKYCTVYPFALLNELEILLEKGITPKLFIDPQCPITTPYDKEYNQLSEKKNKHGSCGVGYSATIEREKNHYSLIFDDLFYPNVMKIKLQMIEEYYEKKIQAIYSTYQTQVFPSDFVEEFINDCYQLIKSNNIEERTLDSIFCSQYVFEGAQGLMLDQNIGFFPHVSRSNCGSKNILKILKSVKQDPTDIEYYLVTRAYQTRHGNGPMLNENKGHNIKDNPNETNVTHKWQGNFRKSLLDLELLHYAIDRDEHIKNSKRQNLVITCLDHIESEYRYTSYGTTVNCDNEKDFVKKLSEGLGIKNVFLSHSPNSKNFKKITI